ncbi:NRAMP-like transporter smf-1 [Aphelenchoides fujianensis]|nr:NRAMP-like transporter smf-1 [Aphelenchoides fujianensis]
MADEEREPLIAGPSDDEFPLMVGVSDSAGTAAESDREDKLSEVVPNDEVIEYLVDIPPELDTKGFSWRKLWAFAGPGWLMSIAYLDPGNIESDLQSGAIARYQLLWILLSAHILGFTLQRLSARLGVVAGKNMAEVSREFYPKVPRIFLWIMIELAIIGSDMQEVIGTAVAIYMLSNGAIPLLFGVVITVVDVMLFMCIDHFGFRKVEALFAFLISTMAASFGYEFFTAKPDPLALAKGMFIPWCSDCGRKEFLQGISVVGAVIMPANLYLHSALVRSRRIDRSKKHKVTEANYYYFIESGIALFCSFIINLFVVGVFAQGLFRKTNNDVHKLCANKTGILDPTNIFPHDDDLVDADLYKGGIFLGCEFGIAALYIWAVGILASGESSTITGTYCGQFVMDGFLRITWPRWRRVLITRLIAIMPTLMVTLFASGITSLTGMNDLLNCLQMIILPFALLPILTFNSSKHIMFEYRSSRRFQFFALLVSFVVIAINLYFSVDYIFGAFGTAWYVLLAMSGPVALYITFVVYLVFSCLVTMEICTDKLVKGTWLSPNFGPLSIKPLWQNRVGDGSSTPDSYGSTSTTTVPIQEQ